MIQLVMSVADAKMIIRALDRVRNQATNIGESSYSIDTLCRKTCAERWGVIRANINVKLPKKFRI